jgi:hypothetical protein
MVIVSLLCSGYHYPIALYVGSIIYVMWLEFLKGRSENAFGSGCP